MTNEKRKRTKPDQIRPEDVGIKVTGNTFSHDSNLGRLGRSMHDYLRNFKGLTFVKQQ